MRADRTAHCCTCGEPRRPTQAPVESLNNGTPIVHVADHGCLVVGLKEAKRWVDDTLQAIGGGS